MRVSQGRPPLIQVIKQVSIKVHLRLQEEPKSPSQDFQNILFQRRYDYTLSAKHVGDENKTLVGTDEDGLV